MAHTQGRWSRNIKPARKYSTIFAGRNTHVAHLATGGLSDEEIEANCDLITAAPDLLDAAKSAIECAITFNGDEAGEGNPHVEIAWEAYHFLKDAIAKATGQ